MENFTGGASGIVSEDGHMYKLSLIHHEQSGEKRVFVMTMGVKHACKSN